MSRQPPVLVAVLCPLLLLSRSAAAEPQPQDPAAPADPLQQRLERFERLSPEEKARLLEALERLGVLGPSGSEGAAEREAPQAAVPATGGAATDAPAPGGDSAAAPPTPGPSIAVPPPTPPAPAVPSRPPATGAAAPDAGASLAERLRTYAAKRKAEAGGHPRERVAMGSSLVVGPGEVVSSVVAFGGTVTVSRGAVVEGDAVAFGGTVTLEEGSVVEGDVVAFGGSVLVQRGVLVEGDTVSFGGAIDVEEGALVEGSRVGPPRHAQRPTRPERTRPRADRSAEPSGLSRVLARGTWVTLAFLAVFTLGWALLALMPRRMDRMQRALARSPGKAMLAGLLASLALVPLCVLLGITGIGLLLVPLALVGFGIAVLTGWVVAAVATGRRLPHRFRRTPVVELMVGLLLFWGLGLFTGVPFLGILAGLALLLATFAGLGGVLLSRFGMPPKATDAAMDPPPEGLTTEEASPAR